MGFKKAILVLLLLIILTMGAASAADTNTASDNLAATENINLELNENDKVLSIDSTEVISDPGNGSYAPGNGTVVIGGTFSDLDTLIQNAGSELNLSENYTYINGDPTSITIDKQITINGNGITIDANNNASVFKIVSDYVKINNITFINCRNETGCGGAIYCTGINFDIYNCSFINCYANDGGSIYCNSLGDSISSCDFINSSASNNGGAINIMCQGDIITNCIFTNCHATRGGAIYSSPYFERITNCIFVNCSANYGGAYLYSGNEVEISNCLFVKCSANYGGAIFSDTYSDGEIRNSEFINLTGSNGPAIYDLSNILEIINSTFEDKTAQSLNDLIYGGIITNCTLNGNKTITAKINIINSINEYKNGNFTFQLTDSYTDEPIAGAVLQLVITGNIKVGFSATTDANGIATFKTKNLYEFSQNSNTLEMKELEIGNHTVELKTSGNVESASIYANLTIIKANINLFTVIDGINATITATNKKNEEAVPGIVLHISYDNQDSYLITDVNGTGNFIANLPCGTHTITVSTNDTKNINYTETNITIDIPYKTFQDLSFIIANTTEGSVLELSDDYIYGNGTTEGIQITKAIIIDGKGHTLDALSNSRIFNILSDGVVLKNINFVNGRCADGGAIYCNGANCSVVNSSFNNNNAEDYYTDGGAIHATGLHFTIINSTFTNNNAPGNGGAIRLGGDNCEIFNCTFTNNEAQGDGGAVITNGANCIISDSKFTNNEAVIYNGGAVRNTGDYCIIRNSIFTSNRASNHYGGAIKSSGIDPIISNSIFIDNHATEGGAFYVTVGFYSSVVNSSFINNTANDKGGAIYFDILGNVTDCTFSGNSNPEIYSNNHTIDTNSTFKDLADLINNASPGDILELDTNYQNDGSVSSSGITISKAITIDGKGHTLDAKGSSRIFKINAENVTLKNIIFKNGHGNNSGAIQWMNTKGVADNCTFINCSAENGGSVYWNGENGMINTSTFDHSTATSNGGAIYWNANNGEIANSIFTNSYAQNGGAVYVPENRNVEIKSSIFDSNIAEEESGAVYGGTVDDDCTFKNNTYTPLNTTTIISINETAVYTGNDISITTIVLSQKGGFANTGTVEIYINSKLMATIPANTQYIHTTGEIGTYQVLAKFIDDSSYKGSSSTAEFTVIPVDIPEEIETNNEGIFTLEFPDDAEGTLTVFIDGVKYKVYDIIGGILKIDLSDKKGKYNITFEYSGDKNYPAFKKDANATIQTNPSITASNAKVLYSAGTTYKITVYKNKGILAKSVSVTIKLNNKKLKPIKTNSKGVASFKVTQTPGTYKLKITSLGKTVTKTLTVKHIVTLKTVTVKKSAKKLILQATLAKVNKKYLKKKTVTFKFNGKTYKAKTNAKGVAKVTIKKSVLKKLKVGKKITYQATYLKDTVKKTAKIKK